MQTVVIKFYKIVYYKNREYIKKTEYALRAVMKIARHSQMRPIQISEISDSEIIPVKFLKQLLLIFKKNNLF